MAHHVDPEVESAGDMHWTLALLLSVTAAFQPTLIASQETCTEPVEELRIGTLDGPERVSFGQIQDLSVGSDGSIFVADLHPQSVKRFDARGQFVRQIGREGEGPGEYRSLLGLEMLSSGELAVWDLGNRRVTIYGAAGEYARSFPVTFGVFARRALVVDSADRFYIKIHLSEPRVLANGRFGGFESGYVRLSQTGGVLDTLRLPPETPEGSYEFGTAGGVLRPFPVQELYTLTRDGQLIRGINSEYSFEIPTDSGPRTVERPDRPFARVSTEEHREWERQRNYLERRSGLSFDETPRTKPAFRNLWTDAEGRIWVHRYVEALRHDLPSSLRSRSGPPRPNITWREPPVFDVFAQDGEFLECVQLPSRARLMESRSRLLWGVVRGSYDEEYVVRWKLPDG